MDFNNLAHDMATCYTRDPQFGERLILDLAVVLHRRSNAQRRTGHESLSSAVCWNCQVIAANFYEQLGFDATVDEIAKGDE
jgi:hypothetical protein